MYRAALLLLFLACTLSTKGAHVLFNFRDFRGINSDLTNRTIHLTPKSTPRTDNGDIIPSDRISFTTDTNASFTVSNIVYGTYAVEVQGPFAFTPFLILVPETNILLNATGLLASVTVPAATAGYTQSAINAMLATNVQAHLEAGTNIFFTTNTATHVVTVHATGDGGSGGGAGSQGVTLGTGSPETVETSDPGILFFDVTAQAMYLKQTGTGNTGWILLFDTDAPAYEGGFGGGGSASGGVTIGTGSPQGNETADPGEMFWSTTANAFWLKQSGTGNTGWILLFSF